VCVVLSEYGTTIGLAGGSDCRKIGEPQRKLQEAE